ncbi:MAG TPA: glycine dehydrogenase (aminomethyl-transferring), partial [Chitinophagales bacterium]|nr:glycine dehydrogenase (aminomethyl-transferring) [Chitinophagales bacterium]
MSQFPDSSFAPRHIGPDAADTAAMLKTIGADSLDSLIDSIVPKDIRLSQPLDLPEAMDEHEYLKHIRRIAQENKLFKSFIGLGYYGTITPSVIQRNLFENPGWYTQYTPYQAEISQGRLESLLNFQTMVCDLTALPVSNASLLDEATAAAEAMMLFYHALEANQQHRDSFFVANTCFPQTIDVLTTRAEPLGIKLVIGNASEFDFGQNVFGALLQYPDMNGALMNHRDWIAKAHQAGIRVAMASDLLALCMVTPPGEMDADVALGSAQRFGVPMGFGGPHAGFLSCKDEYKRLIPGRLIGVSIDAEGRQAYRMALQTREQHIRREKATSNICTAQALLANMAAMYAVHHGPKGLKKIAETVHEKACALADSLRDSGFKIVNEQYFDTLFVDTSAFGHQCFITLHQGALAKQYNLRYVDETHIGIALDETTTWHDVETLAQIFAHATGREVKPLKCESVNSVPKNLRRTSDYLTHPVFNRHHSETEMMRYLKALENKDLSLTNAMIPLGSCTMKLNAASEMFPVSIPEFAHQHPFVPLEQVPGYLKVITELEKYLSVITGFAACSLQPNSGAQGEYAGL